MGSALLLAVVVGSGIAAERLSPGEPGLQLLTNALVTALGLGVLILVLGPVSGAHLNPVVSLVDWALGRRAGAGLASSELALYVGAQVVGAAAGTVLANLMYGLPAVEVATTERGGVGRALGEVVATAGLVAVVFALARNGRAAATAAAVGAYIGAAYWFTSSTSFANPAVTLARTLSDTFAGIAPASVPLFLAAQAVGAVLGAALVLALYPDAPAAADRVVVPSEARDRSEEPA